MNDNRNEQFDAWKYGPDGPFAPQPSPVPVPQCPAAPEGREALDQAPQEGKDE